MSFIMLYYMLYEELELMCVKDRSVSWDTICQQVKTNRQDDRQL